MPHVLNLRRFSGGKLSSRWRAALACAFGLVCSLVLAYPAYAQTLRMGGTGAALGSMALLAKAYQQKDPAFQFEILPNLGSAGGVKALNTGAVQLAVIGRALKPQEAATGLVISHWGQTAFVLATAKPGIDGLSLAQVADLYSGRMPRWGDGQPVRLVLRPASDGDTALLAAMSSAVRAGLDAAMAREGMVMAMTDQDSVSSIERMPGGLGTAALSLLISEQRRARPLAIDGVAPTLENMASGRYPYLKTMLVATRPDAPASVSAFLAFVRSEAGARILAESGHIAMPIAGKPMLALGR